jgi:hypothetical protein
MPEQSTNTEPLLSNEGDYLKLANELKSQFDEEKAKWKAKFTILEKQNNSMKGYIKRINNVTGEIIKTNNKRMFDEIDNGTSGSSEPPRRRRRRGRILVSRTNAPDIFSERTGGPESLTEREREVLNFVIHNIEQQVMQESANE